MVLDPGADGVEIEGSELLLAAESDRALRVADLHVLKVPHAPAGVQLPAPVVGPGRVIVAAHTRTPDPHRAGAYPT